MGLFSDVANAEPGGRGRKITEPALGQSLDYTVRIQDVVVKRSQRNNEDLYIVEFEIVRGSEIVTRTNDAFSKVAESSSKVGELVGEIAAASNEQADGINQINTAVTEMDKVVQQNATNAEESASASEEMNTQAELMKAYVKELVMLVSGQANTAKNSRQTEK